MADESPAEGMTSSERADTPKPSAKMRSYGPCEFVAPADGSTVKLPVNVILAVPTDGKDSRPAYGQIEAVNGTIKPIAAKAWVWDAGSSTQQATLPFDVGDLDPAGPPAQLIGHAADDHQLPSDTEPLTIYY
jgi:hypothetical protein